jgi:guanylate kinase
MKILKNNGVLIVLSGPSGSGKNTVLSKMMRDKKIFVSVSATTRPPRRGEVDGVHYHFVTKDEFEDMIEKGDVLEYTTYCQNYYGTLKSKVMEEIESGNTVILEIEVEGGMQIKKAFPQAVLVFLTAPSLDEVKNRLVLRRTESDEAIEGRLRRAKEEFKIARYYDYIVINDSVENAAKELEAIILAQKCRTENRTQYINEV